MVDFPSEYQRTSPSIVCMTVGSGHQVLLGLAKIGFVDPQQFSSWLLFALSLADIMEVADAISISVAQGARAQIY